MKKAAQVRDAYPADADHKVLAKEVIKFDNKGYGTERLLHAGAGPVRVMGAAFGVGSLLLGDRRKCDRQR